MFGLSNLFAAIRGLTESITETRHLFDAANQELRQRLAVEVEEEPPALLEHHPSTNGSTRQSAKARSK